MKTEELNVINLLEKNQSKKISNYKFRNEYSMLYVLNKFTNQLVFIILDVTDLNKAMSLAKCLLNYNDISRRLYYSIQELKQLFKDQKKSLFTESVEYEKKKSLLDSETPVKTNNCISQTSTDTSNICLYNDILIVNVSDCKPIRRDNQSHILKQSLSDQLSTKRKTSVKYNSITKDDNEKLSVVSKKIVV